MAVITFSIGLNHKPAQASAHVEGDMQMDWKRCICRLL